MCYSFYGPVVPKSTNCIALDSGSASARRCFRPSWLPVIASGGEEAGPGLRLGGQAEAAGKPLAATGVRKHGAGSQQDGAAQVGLHKRTKGLCRCYFAAW